MNPVTKAFHATGAGLKAAGSTVMHWVGRTTSSWFSRVWLPNTRIDYAKEVGDPMGSSIVLACVLWVCRTFPESPFAVWDIAADGKKSINRKHPLTLLIARPNVFHSGLLLWWATLADFIQGNAYWLKVRSGAGKVVELWYIPAAQMEPKWADTGTEFIGWYEYKPDATKKGDRYEVGDVCHFRYGIDPTNTRKGLSPFGALLREIFTDNGAAAFTATLLKNLGIPGLIISPKKDATISKETAEQVKETANQRFSGDNLGSTMVMLGPTEATMLGYSPEQMGAKELRRIPEERVSAVLGVPAIVAGLGAGLDRSTFANFAEARELAFEGGIIPMQRLLAAEIAIQLLPDFDTSENVEVGFDLSQVRVLQDDQDALYKREIAAVNGGLKMVSEGRTAIGLESGPEHDIFLVPAGFTVVPKDYVLPELPAPTPPTVVEVTPPALLPPPAKGLNGGIGPTRLLVKAKGTLTAAEANRLANLLDASSRDANHAAMEARLTDAANAFEASGDTDAFRAAMAESVAAGAINAYRIAAGRRIAARDLPKLTALLTEQDTFLDGFIADLAGYTPGGNGKSAAVAVKGVIDTFAGVLSRALAYVVAAVQGAAFGWMADKTDEDTVTWVTAGDDRVSDTCSEMEGRHTIAELNDGGIFPGVGVDCGPNCRCELA